jgi:hypothetical protein
MGEGGTYGTEWNIPDEQGNGDMDSTNLEEVSRKTIVPS